ncbi:MAG: hypothetical protein D6689_22125 [Deltaproteobacteria bacterium]|nr:MAG: hypothetical protein D6689_22125 [Deltaproteobacteria bacterium]
MDRGIWISLRVRGSSMWPAVRDGSVVEIRPCSVDELRLGDLVAFERTGCLVVHRLVDRRGGRLRFAGDAVIGDDGWFEPGAVLGRVRVLSRPPVRWRVPRPGDARVLVRSAWRVAACRLRAAV